MVNSMTGFGRAQDTRNGREITVELRSVNHRFLEVNTRVPRAYSFIEDKLKPVLNGRISRGKVDVGVTIVTSSADETVELNLEIAKSYADALNRIAEELKVPNEVTAMQIARFPDVFTVVKEQPDEAQIWSDVSAVLDAALDGYCAMRAAEGKKLEEDLLARLDTIEAAIGEIEKESETRLERYRDKLFTRMKSVLDDTDIDESRILLEAAVFADKSAVDEETVRLRSHLAQFRQILRADEPVGRKLDFLIQEINRETNTIGSKANDLDITTVVVELKAEIEKIREQVQNIE